MDTGFSSLRSKKDESPYATNTPAEYTEIYYVQAPGEASDRETGYCGCLAFIEALISKIKGTSPEYTRMSPKLGSTSSIAPQRLKRPDQIS